MKKQNILLVLMALAFTFTLPQVGMAQQSDTEQSTQGKHHKGDLYKAHQAAIEAIQNDASLTESEKEALIVKKRNELRENVGKRGQARGDRKGKFASKEAREEWKKSREAISKEIEAIEKDPNLTDEEKELKRRELLNEKLGEKRRKGKRGGAYKKMDDEERRAYRAERKGELEAIKNDPNLTEEEKQAKKRELFKKSKKEAIIKGRKGDMHHTKGKHKGHKEMTKKEWKEKHGKKGSGFVKKELTDKQKSKALKALTRNEQRLAKDLKKGRISQEKYNSRIAKINQVRENLLKN